jgi:Domain of Unknown Function with PDB structure (DUF3857)
MMDRIVRKFFVMAIASAAVAPLLLAAVPAQDSGLWTAIDPNDLKLDDNPKLPGGPAMVLDYWHEINNLHSNETIRIRIKVFREQGTKYANVEIPYFAKYMQVEDIRARTVTPQGLSSDYNGGVFEKEIVKAKRYKLNAKTLILPNVQVGTIIEYAYRLHWKSGFPDVIKSPGRYLITEPIAYLAGDWEVQRDLFVRHAHLTLRAYPNSMLRNLTVGLPNYLGANRGADGTLYVEFENIPAFEEEESAPPEDSIRGRFVVFYTFGFEEAESFWKSVGRQKGKFYDEFLKKSGRAKSEVQRLIAPGDTDEQKLRKLYARSQEIRMVSYEESKTEKEQKREELKENKNADDVLSRNYAYGDQVNLAFMALAQAAGFKVNAVRLVSRDNHFFQQKFFDPAQLNATVVQVILDGKPRYFDPATKYCPYDLVPWAETDTIGVLADQLKPAVLQLQIRPSSEAVVRRSAELTVDDEGNVEGDVHLVFEGQEALLWRLDARNEDDAQRRESLEDWLKAILPDNSECTLTSSDGWTKSDGPVTATLHVQTHGYASQVGQRLLLRLGYFKTSENKPLFSSAHRTHPIYFRYPMQSYDIVRITPPKGFAVEATPAALSIKSGAANFDLKAEKLDRALQITRSFVLGANYFPTDKYWEMRDFFRRVAVGDEGQAALKRLAPSTAQAN